MACPIIFTSRLLYHQDPLNMMLGEPRAGQDYLEGSYIFVSAGN